jgi:cytoskeletal protein CcmA (bactofilin family)
MNSGKINGTITAIEKVHILKPGVLVGDIRTPVIAIEEGSQFQGMCDMGAHHWSNERTLSVDVSPDLLASAH